MVQNKGKKKKQAWYKTNTAQHIHGTTKKQAWYKKKKRNKNKHGTKQR